jgi:hypothetical protein
LPLCLFAFLPLCLLPLCLLLLALALAQCSKRVRGSRTEGYSCSACGAGITIRVHTLQECGLIDDDVQAALLHM